MKFMCLFLPHKWEQTYQFNAESGPMSNGTLVFYKCSRCGKIKMDFKANVTFGKSSVNATSSAPVAPSVTRKLVEAADGTTLQSFIDKESSTKEEVSVAA